MRPCPPSPPRTATSSSSLTSRASCFESTRFAVRKPRLPFASYSCDAALSRCACAIGASRSATMLPSAFLHSGIGRSSRTATRTLRESTLPATDGAAGQHARSSLPATRTARPPPESPLKRQIDDRQEAGAHAGLIGRALRRLRGASACAIRATIFEAWGNLVSQGRQSPLGKRADRFVGCGARGRPASCCSAGHRKELLDDSSRNCNVASHARLWLWRLERNDRWRPGGQQRWR